MIKSIKYDIQTQYASKPNDVIKFEERLLAYDKSIRFECFNQLRGQKETIQSAFSIEASFRKATGAKSSKRKIWTLNVLSDSFNETDQSLTTSKVLLEFSTKKSRDAAQAKILWQAKQQSEVSFNYATVPKVIENAALVTLIEVKGDLFASHCP